MDERIRPALPTEAASLTALALRSKAHWGYDAAFMTAAVPEMTLAPERLAHACAHVLERDGAVVGFYVLGTEDGRPTLADLWIEPSAIGTGAGTTLFLHMRSEAGKLGYRTVAIVSEPHAEGFYERMGARRVGMTPSTVVPGRVLPLMELTI